MTVRLGLLALAIGSALTATHALAAGPGSTAQSAAVTYKDTPWEDLMPKGWDPLKRYRDANVGALNDDVKSLRRDVASQVALEMVDRLFPMAGEFAGGFFHVADDLNAAACRRAADRLL